VCLVATAVLQTHRRPIDPEFSDFDESSKAIEQRRLAQIVVKKTKKEFFSENGTMPAEQMSFGTICLRPIGLQDSLVLRFLRCAVSVTRVSRSMQKIPVFS